MCVCFTWRLCYWIWPHTHTLNMVERPHSLIHIYLYTQTGFYEAVRETGLFNIAGHKQRFISMHDSRAAVSSGVAKQKRKTIGENWYKRTQLPKKYHSGHSKRNKKKDDICFFPAIHHFYSFVMCNTHCVYIFGGSEKMLNKYPNGMQREVRRKKSHWQEWNGNILIWCSKLANTFSSPFSILHKIWKL